MDSSTNNIENESEENGNTAETANTSVTNSKKNRIMFRWKGKIVKESVYRHKLAIIEAHKRRKELLAFPVEPKIPVEGRRIVDLQLLAKHMECTSCKEILSLRDIKSETRRGLASIFHVECRSCSQVNCVPTSGRTVSKENSRGKYDVNSEFVHGSAQTDLPLSRLNKLLDCLNIPHVQSKLFQRYKEESVQNPVVLATKNPTIDNPSADAALAPVETVQTSETIQQQLIPDADAALAPVETVQTSETIQQQLIPDADAALAPVETVQNSETIQQHLIPNLVQNFFH